MRHIPLLAATILLTTSALGTAQSSPSFSIIHRWHLGGTGSWNRLTVDSQSHRLYVTRGERVVVMDTQTGHEIGEIGGGKSTRAVCLNPNGRTGYFVDGESGFVRVFDRTSLRVIASIAAGSDPDAAALDPMSDTLLVANDESKDATLIDITNNRPVATISLPGRPASVVTDGQGHAFVSIDDANELARLNLRDRKLIGTWPINGCSGPTGLAMDAAQQVVYGVCENNRLFATDARSGELLSSIGLPEGTRDLALDSRRGLLFAASGGGILTALEANHPRRLAVLESVKTMPGARTVAVDARTGDVYLDTSEFGLRTGETSEELRFRPTPVADTFVVLVIGKPAAAKREGGSSRGD